MKALLGVVAALALAVPAHAQLFGSSDFTINTTNSPSSASDSVPFGNVLRTISNGDLTVQIAITDAPDFATTGRQWAVFTYTTPTFAALSAGGENWSIEQVGIPLVVNADFIADFTQWTVDGAPITQVSPIFGQTLGSTPVPGHTGNGEGTSGFVDAIPAGPAPQLGAFADPFQLVINGLGGTVPTGFVQALEFQPASFVPPPNGVPEASTWLMVGIGFAGLGCASLRRRWKRPRVLAVP